MLARSHFISDLLTVDQHRHQSSSDAAVVPGVVEGGCPSSVAEPARPPDPVDVLLHSLGQVVVDDVCHPWDVQAPGRHSCRNQDWLPITLEVL